MGLKVSALHLKILNPLPKDILNDFISNTTRIIIPEHNRQGQLAGILRNEFDFSPFRLNKYDGLPFTANEILNALLDVSENVHSKRFK